MVFHTGLFTLVTLSALSAVLFILLVLFVAELYRFLVLAVKTDGPSLKFLLINLGSITRNTLAHTTSWCHEYSFKMCRVFLLDNVIFLVSDPDDVAAVMKNKDMPDKPYLHYGVLGSMLGRDTLLTINGERSKRHRKGLNPAFRKEVLFSCISQFSSEAQKFAENLPLGTSCNIYASLLMFQLSAACKAMLCHDLDLLKHLPNVCEHITNLFEYAHIKSVNPVSFYLFERFQKRYQSTMDGLALALKTFQEATSKVKDDLEEKLKSSDRPTECSLSSALEHVLYENKGGSASLSEDEIYAEFLVLVAAGGITTSATTILVLAALALHPAAQAKVADEVHSVFGDSERVATMDDVRKMEYLDRVIKETLRLYPVIPMMARAVKEQTEIQGKVVPKGSMVGVIIAALHRNPKYFENPDEFEPDRFLPGYTEKIPDYAYIPFGAGERICVGQRLAVLQAKTFLLTLLRKYQVWPGDGLRAFNDINIVANISLAFPDGVPLRFDPVNKRNKLHSRA